MLKNLTNPQAGAIGAGLSAGQGILGSIMGFRQQKIANRYNLEMWNRQNEYNHPKAQMQRLKEAGLNPNLIYGQGSGGATGQASGAPTFEKLNEQAYTPIDMPNTIGALQSFTDWDLKKQQSAKIQAETNATKASTLLSIAKTAFQGYQNKKARAEEPYFSEMAKTSYDSAVAGLQKIITDTEFTRKQIDNNALETRARVYDMLAGAKLKFAQKAKVIEDTRVQKFYGDLAAEGISPDTPWYGKMVGDWIKKLQAGENPFQALVDAAKNFSPSWIVKKFFD